MNTNTKSFNAFLTSRLAILIIIIILISSLLIGSMLIAATCITLIFLTLGTITWSKASGKKVLANIDVSQAFIFSNESTNLKVNIKNNKILPIWTCVQITSEDNIILAENEFGLISFSHFKFETNLKYHKRGIYNIGSVCITTGDLFGFHKNSLTHPIDQQILVFPKIIPIESVNIDSLDFFGNFKSNHFIDDPAMTAGIKDYDYSSSFKSIDWIASSKTLTLKEKIYDPMSHIDLCIFIDVNGYKNNDEDAFEVMLSVVATLLIELNTKKYKYKLITNGLITDTDLKHTLDEQYLEDLSTLAKIKPVLSSKETATITSNNSYVYYFCYNLQSAVNLDTFYSYDKKIFTATNDRTTTNTISIKDIINN